MKKLIFIVVVSGIFSIPSFADDSYGCEKKLQALEKQLEYAKQYGNSYRISGLERGISNVKKYCGGGYPLDSKEAKEYYATNSKLEVMEKIEDAKKDLAKAEYKLGKAQRKNDAEDVFEAEYKIKEAQGRIEMYEKYLSEF